MGPGMGVYERALRPLLFALPPDRVHDWTQWLLGQDLWRHLDAGFRQAALRTAVGGLDLEGPLGLAAGFDKNGDLLPAVAALGFGFEVVGSVRPRPHPGNPRPWFARRTDEGGLVNAMGLPSRGASYVADRLRGREGRIPRLVSLAGESAADFQRVRAALDGLADGWEVNVSCPNTETGRAFEEDTATFERLLEALPPPTPATFVKFSPPEDAAGRDRVLELASRAVRRGYRGFTLCNTLPVAESRVAGGRGGLSGPPLRPHVLGALRDFRRTFGGEVDLLGVGGVNTGEDALRMVEAGARAVQILTALIYRGPLAAVRIHRELAAALRQRGYASLREAVGRAAE